MGCDIHGVFQRRDKDTGQWHGVPSKYEQGRHYQLFAVLAGVRNGSGFAGIRTGEQVTPISEPRGHPDDFKVELDDYHIVEKLEHIDPRRQKWHTPEHMAPDENPLALWMGDHSFSWLTGAEMLAWYETAPVVTHYGVFDRSDYESWDKKSPPSFGYSAGITGRDVVLILDTPEERAKTPNWTHIKCRWSASLKEELSYFFDEVKRLQDEHGEIRFVFGFDS